MATLAGRICPAVWYTCPTTKGHDPASKTPLPTNTMFSTKFPITHLTIQ